MPRFHAASRLLATAALAGALTACAGPTESISPDFGNSVRHNMMMHIIDPAPKYGQTQPTLSGPRAAGALDRYEKGKSTPVKVETTTKSTN